MKFNGVKFSAFLSREMANRQMSERQFAKFVGVAHGTINRFINYELLKSQGKKVSFPSLDFLLRLSRSTKVDICSILALIDPASTKAVSDPDSVNLSNAIEQLDDATREVIDAIILGKAKQSKKGGKG